VKLAVFKATPIKISISLFREIENSILKFIWKHKRPKKVISILSKSSSTGGVTIPGFQLHYKNHRNKNSMVLA
jgi:hypothetical protein